MYYWVRKTCLDFFSISSYNRYYDSFISISTTIAKTLKSIILSKMTSFAWILPHFIRIRSIKVKRVLWNSFVWGHSSQPPICPRLSLFASQFRSISDFFGLFAFRRSCSFFVAWNFPLFCSQKRGRFFTDLDNWKMNSRGRGKFSMSIHFFFFNFTLYFSYSIACLRVIFSVNFLETCLESVLEFSRICHFFRLEWIYSPAYSKHPKILLII